MSAQNLKPLIGQTLRSYELRAVVGVGGFGIVYQAYQLVVERDVAIKVILPQYADDPEFIRRFEGEARIIAHLEHPYIVPLYDFWREPGGAYLVMRWLKGGSLRDLLLHSRSVDPHTVAHFLDQISEALTVAHQRGIVHQDIKPENILLDEFQNAYLSDFGIAKTPSGSGEDNENQQSGFGTAAYASPEQIMHKPVTAQTDIYNLGMMIYELLTGDVPFAAEDEATILYRQLHESVPFVERENIPSAVSEVIWRATAKKPDERFSDAIMLAEAFRQALGLEKRNPARGIISATPSVSRDTLPSIATRLLFPSGEINPYKGLQAFSEADETDFFGREEQLARLEERLRLMATRSKFLAIIGPSGSGKSSLVQAGLIPRLRRGVITKFEQVFIAEIHPGDEPFNALERALLQMSPKILPDISVQLRDGEDGLVHVLEQILPDAATQFVLVIDQFEEIFTQVKHEEERKLFFDILVQTLGKPSSRFHLIITLRADFYDRPLMYEALGELLRNNTEVVLPLTLDGLQQAIVEPAKRAGIHLEQGLLSSIIEDVHRQPSALPLLQHALTELYNRRDGTLLTQSAYRESGGVVGALAGRAEEIFLQLDYQGREAARQIFLNLIVPGDGSTHTSRRVFRAELMTFVVGKSAIDAVLNAFGNYRLLTFDHDPTTRSPTVQIAHEALIQAWTRLGEWIDANQQELRLQQNLRVAAHDWLHAQREASFLATGARLAQFEMLRENSKLILNEDEKQYLKASIALRHQATNRLRLIIAVLAIFSILALMLAAFALDQQRTAVTERDRANQEVLVSRSRELAVSALTNQTQTDLSLLLSVEAFRSADTFEARNSLLTALQTQPHLATFFHGHTDGVRTVAFSPDGRLLASGGRDNLILIWNVASGQLVGQALTGHTGWINAIAFSPDGSTLASASEDGTIRLWDVQSARLIGQPLTGHTGAVRSVTFSPDGRLLASAGADHTVRLWDVETGAADGQALSEHSDVVWDVVFSPDGKTLASASADQTVRLWDVASRKPIGDPLVGHSNWVLSVAFSPNGQLLASGSADNSIILWDVQRHTAIGQPLVGHENWVRSVAFSPDGNHLISGSADQTVKLWNLQTLPQVSLEDTYREHSDAVWDAAFSPDGQSIASAGADDQVLLWRMVPALMQSINIPGEVVMSATLNSRGDFLASGGGSRTSFAKIRLWDVPTGALRQEIQTPDSLITSLVFSPDGLWLASGGTDSSVRIWNVETGLLQSEWVVPDATTIYAVAFNPDGHLLAVGADTPEVTLWDATTGRLQKKLEGQTDSIYSVAFSADGRLLASGSGDTTIRLWETASGQAYGLPLEGHTDAVMSVAFSADGQLLASGSRDTTVRLWDIPSGQAHGEPLQGHSDWVTSVAFSPDSQLLVSGSQDDSLRLWNVATGRLLGVPFNDGSDGINSTIFSPNGNLLVSGGQNGSIHLRTIGLPTLLDTACKIANRNLSDVEWQQYFPAQAFHATCIDISSPAS
ncbi:MAG: protein kinase [Chloroflexota bacterium]